MYMYMHLISFVVCTHIAILLMFVATIMWLYMCEYDFNLLDLTVPYHIYIA